MHAVGGAQFNEVVLIEKGRAGADKAHIAFEYAPELGQFVEAGFADEGSDGREPNLGFFEQMGGYCRSVRAHAAELRHFEDHIVFANAVRPIKRGPFGCDSHGDCDDHHGPNQDGQCQQG